MPRASQPEVGCAPRASGRWPLERLGLEARQYLRLGASRQNLVLIWDPFLVLAPVPAPVLVPGRAHAGCQCWCWPCWPSLGVTRSQWQLRLSRSQKGFHCRCCCCCHYRYRCRGSPSRHSLHWKLKSGAVIASFIVNALKENRSVSIAGAGRVKSVGPVRTGVLPVRGGVSIVSIVLLWVMEHCPLSKQHILHLRLTR